MSEFVDFAADLSYQKDLSFYTQRFNLDPQRLAGLRLPVELKWHRIRFLIDDVNDVLPQPGVYAFAIGHENPGLPPHGYVIYIGQTGAKKNERTLRHRVKEYFREKTRPKRGHVHYFLNKWDQCLFFHFAPVDPGTVNLLSLEAQLNDAFMPPYSRQDFSPEIRRRKRIWEKS
jgi:hypothetical protein